MKGRNVPPLTIPAADMHDDRRIRACLQACAHISTEALESGLVHAVFEELGLATTAHALAADLARQGKNPADYINFARGVKQAAPVLRRMEASGYNEAQNRAWEARTGQQLDTGGATVLHPLRGRT